MKRSIASDKLFPLALAIWLFAVIPTVASAVPVQWPNSAGGNNHYYDLVRPAAGITWTDARNAAAVSTFQGASGYLVTVGSQAEWSFIIAQFPEDWTWIGLTDEVQEGIFQWVTGEPVTFTRWIPGEPNNAGEEDYTFYQRSSSLDGDFGWNDFRNSANVFSADLPIGYVVEYVPEPATWILLSMGLLGGCFARGLGRSRFFPAANRRPDRSRWPLFHAALLAALLGTLSRQTVQAGPIVAWGGSDIYGETNVPVGDFSAITASIFHGIGLRADGVLVPWGFGNYGETNVPPGTFTAVSTNNDHSLGLRSDGTVAGWGLSNVGQTTSPGGQFVAIAAGDSFSIGLRSNGALVGWGSNQYGQRNVPNGSFTAVAAGTLFAVAIRTDGTLAAWGYNGEGDTNVPSGTFTKIAAGFHHGLAIRSDGSLAGWGYNAYGQTNVPAGVFVDIAAGDYHSLAIRSDGTLVAWGQNDYGQLNVPAGQFVDVAAGMRFSAAIRAIPEPTAATLFGFGLLGVAAARALRRLRKAVPAS